MTKYRPSPFTIRFTDDERAILLERAAGRPLGTFIKATVFSDPLRLRATRPTVRDQVALGRVLGLLGRSHLANNLNQIAKAANQGALPVTPELQAELHDACADIRRMRNLLMEALGVEASSPPAKLTDTFGGAAG